MLFGLTTTKLNKLYYYIRERAMATWNELVYEVYSGLIVLVLTVDASRFSAAVTDCMFVTFCAGLYVPIKYQPLAT